MNLFELLWLMFFIGGGAFGGISLTKYFWPASLLFGGIAGALAGIAFTGL